MSNASADEEDFLELVVANETVCTWLDKWKSYAKDSVQDQNVDRYDDTYTSLIRAF